MKRFTDIKSIFLSKVNIRNILIGITVFSFFAAVGIATFRYMQDRILYENLNKTTEAIRSVWSIATIVHQETMGAYVNYYIVDDELLRLFELASVPEKQPEARIKLYRHLYGKYQELSSKLSVRQLNFILPDNTVLIRFHAPNRYGDDLTSVRPSVVYVNREKSPFFGLELGKVFVGYRYLFPVFSKEGKYLGCIELAKSFETIRRGLSQIDENGGYVLLIKKSEVEKKVLEEYRGYYQPFVGLEDWMVESTEGKLADAPKPLNEEFLNVLRSINLKPIISSKKDITVYTQHDGKYYKITAIKFSQPYEDGKSLVLLRVSKSDDIASVITTVFEFKLIYLILLALISVGIVLYLNRNYSIKLKNRELELITSTMGSGLVILDTEGNVKFINQTALNVLGFSYEEIHGLSFHEAVHHHAGLKENCPVFLAIKDRKEYNGDDVFKTKDGRFIDVSLKLRPLVIDDIYVGAVVVFDDITERKELEKRLFQLATIDPLTGLYNRRYTLESLKKFKNMSERYGYLLSVIMLDIDNFKKINDTYGHDVGDDVLKMVATSIKENIRSADVPSRWGGEEFLVVLPNTDLDGAVNLAERIRDSISKIEVGPVKRFTVSVGVAQYIFGESLDDLIVRADRGLYEAKRSGKNRVVAV